MTKRLFLGTSTISAAQQLLIADVLQGTIWWHHVPNLWLIKDETDKLTPAILRDKLTPIIPNLLCLVSEVSPTRWWAGTYNSADKSGSFASWLKEHWEPAP